MIGEQENNCSPMGLNSEVNPSRTRQGHQSYNHRGNMRKQKTENRKQKTENRKQKKEECRTIARKYVNRKQYNIARQFR